MARLNVVGHVFRIKLTKVSLKITVKMIFKMYDGVIYLSSVKVEFSLLMVKQA